MLDETQTDASTPGSAVGLGTAGLVLTVMAYLAPLAGAAGFVTLVIGYGNGLGAPLIFPVAGLILLIFAVGYTAMVRRRRTQPHEEPARRRPALGGRT